MPQALLDQLAYNHGGPCDTCRSCTDQIHVVQAIKGTLCFSLFDHKQHLTEVRSELNHELDNQDQQCLSSVLQSFDDDRK